MGFINKAIKFGSGVVLAQVITAASIPLLTRIYSPENFSKFGLYFSISLILVGFVTMKLEIVLAQSEDIYEKLNKIINVAYMMMIPIGIVSYLVLSVIEKQFSSFNLFVSFLIMIGAFSFALFDMINITNIRDNKIGLANKGRIFRSLFAIIFQFFFSFFQKIGLFLGEVIGRFVGLLLISKKDFYRLNLLNGYRFLKEKFTYIKYIVFANFINSIGINIYPILVISFYDPILIGKYFFIYKIVASPISLITQSLSMSILGDFNQLIKQEASKLIIKINKISLILFIFSTTIFVFLGFIIQKFETLIFGQDWKGVSIFVFLLIPFLVGQCAFSPFSQLLVLLGGEKKQLIWDLTRVIVVISLVLIPNLTYLNFDFYYLLFIYSIIGFLFYIFHYSMIINELNSLKNKK